RRLWNIPGPRRKGKKGQELPLTVPLPPRCVEILAVMAGRTGKMGLIFPGRGGNPISEKGMADVIQKLGYADAASPHGFRSTFRDWGGDCTNYPDELLEAALGHKLPNSVERAYRRGSALRKRGVLMADWAAYCAGLPTSDNVISPQLRS